MKEVKKRKGKKEGKEEKKLLNLHFLKLDKCTLLTLSSRNVILCGITLALKSQQVPFSTQATKKISSGPDCLHPVLLCLSPFNELVCVCFSATAFCAGILLFLCQDLSLHFLLMILLLVHSTHVFTGQLLAVFPTNCCLLAVFTPQP